MGIEALSELSGLNIVSGHYKFEEGGVIIYAEGQGDGVLWQITAIWPLGGNLTIVQHSPKLQL